MLILPIYNNAGLGLPDSIPVGMVVRRGRHQAEETVTIKTHLRRHFKWRSLRRILKKEQTGPGISRTKSRKLEKTFFEFAKKRKINIL